jgi:hypothetical protein
VSISEILVLLGVVELSIASEDANRSVAIASEGSFNLGDNGGDVLSIGDIDEVVWSDGLLFLDIDFRLSVSSRELLVTSYVLTAVEDVSIDNLSPPIDNWELLSVVGSIWIVDVTGTIVVWVELDAEREPELRSGDFTGVRDFCERKGRSDLFVGYTPGLTGTSTSIGRSTAFRFA